MRANNSYLVNNNVVSRFVYGSRANVPDYMVTGGVEYRIIADNLGSPRLVVNTQTGAVAEEIDYDEFGNVTNDTNPGFQPFGYVGGLYDRDLKLVRFGARDYDPDVGRWIVKDRLLFNGREYNLYGYGLNDSINHADVLGLSWDDVPTILGSYQQAVQNMNSSGQRLPIGTGTEFSPIPYGLADFTVGTLVGLANDASTAIPWWEQRFGWRPASSSLLGWVDCVDQADRVADYLETMQTFVPGSLDAQWTFVPTGIGGREIVVATSNNPSDPSIVLDPWGNAVYVIP
jgi:RHS repeat-associated protein